jgi:tRNA(Ile)-lysidine synthase
MLLHIFKRLNIKSTVVHINYEQRGEESRLDQELVNDVTDDWEFPCYTFRVGEAFEKSKNFQNQAREIRYRQFERIRQKVKANAVAIAHHQDDQIETILQKVLRGAGMESWSAMSLMEDHIFRPLLHTPKREIDAYVQSWDIPYRIDQSNRKSVYARNFLRNEWGPWMDQLLPGWRNNLLKLSKASDRYTRILDALIDSAEELPDTLNRDHVLTWEMEVRKPVFLRWIKRYDADISISKNALDELQKLDKLDTGQYLQLSADLQVVRDRNIFELRKNNKSDEASEKVFVVDQETLSDKSKKLADWRLQINKYANPNFKRSLYLDVANIYWPLRMRVWQAGDRFQPLGMQGTQRVKEHLTNRKVSATRKHLARVLSDQHQRIVAVLFPRNHKSKESAGVGSISELVKCDQETQKALIVTPLNNENL